MLVVTVEDGHIRSHIPVNLVLSASKYDIKSKPLHNLYQDGAHYWTTNYTMQKSRRIMMSTLVLLLSIYVYI